MKTIKRLRAQCCRFIFQLVPSVAGQSFGKSFSLRFRAGGGLKMDGRRFSPKERYFNIEIKPLLTKSEEHTCALVFPKPR